MSIRNLITMQVICYPHKAKIYSLTILLAESRSKVVLIPPRVFIFSELLANLQLDSVYTGLEAHRDT